VNYGRYIENVLRSNDIDGKIKIGSLAPRINEVRTAVRPMLGKFALTYCYEVSLAIAANNNMIFSL